MRAVWEEWLGASFERNRPSLFHSEGCLRLLDVRTPFVRDVMCVRVFSTGAGPAACLFPHFRF